MIGAVVVLFLLVVVLGVALAVAVRKLMAMRIDPEYEALRIARAHADLMEHTDAMVSNIHKQSGVFSSPTPGENLSLPEGI
ncbi:MAG: hypothetical protein V3U14_12800 [candidate division NC10 bacterium]